MEVGAFFDVFPLSLLTMSTLDRFNELSPDTRFDQRRFRMNVIVATSEPGFVENGWVGRGLAIGDDAQVMVVMPDPRCVMPTLAQEDLPRDNEVMRTLVRHNRLDAGGAMSPCAGVYAAVSAAGTLRTGDEVRMAVREARRLQQQEQQIERDDARFQNGPGDRVEYGLGKCGKALGRALLRLPAISVRGSGIRCA